TTYLRSAVSRVTLASSTGGRDADRDGRDDGVYVVLTPEDYDGDAVKAPGAIDVRLFEIAESGVKRPLDSWTVDETEVRAAWKAGLLGQGYAVERSFQTPPKTDKLRVVARFVTADGRPFETERDVSIKRNPAAVAKRDPSEKRYFLDGPLEVCPTPTAALRTIESMEPPPPTLQDAPTGALKPDAKFADGRLASTVAPGQEPWRLRRGPKNKVVGETLWPRVPGARSGPAAEEKTSNAAPMLVDLTPRAATMNRPTMVFPTDAPTEAAPVVAAADLGDWSAPPPPDLTKPAVATRSAAPMAKLAKPVVDDAAVQPAAATAPATAEKPAADRRAVRLRRPVVAR
ncbi:MAG: hypothetical protein ACRC1K_01490, partial [Planctomycetia bacterium]